MNLKPRHLAALQCGILAMFLIAIWLVMLTPFEHAAEQIRHMLVDEKTKAFSVSLAIATIGATLLTSLFCLKQSESKNMSAVLAFVSIGFFGLAIWQFSLALILGFGVAGILAVWGWRSSNSSLHTDSQTSQ
jgi:hypothetical protein